jgi:hypothetical protein
VNSQVLRGIEFLDVNGRETVTHGKVDCFARVLIEFCQVRKAQSSNVKLSERSLADRKTRNSEVVRTFSTAVKKGAGLQVHQKTVNGADGKPRLFCDLHRSKASFGSREQLQEPQSALQSGDVVSTFSCECHRSTPCQAEAEMKVRII